MCQSNIYLDTHKHVALSFGVHTLMQLAAHTHALSIGKWRPSLQEKAVGDSVPRGKTGSKVSY